MLITRRTEIMGTEKLLEQEMPQWVKSLRRHAHFAQSIETEEMADAELDIQLEIIAAMSEKPAASPLDMLLKLKIWQSFAAPEGNLDELSDEAQLIFSVISDLEAFVDSDGASFATYPATQWAKVS